MIVSDKVAEWLEQKGITHAFTIIGGGNIILFDAISRRGATELISCHHEQAAVMAAHYYYRTSGRIALALVTSGAGSTNALTGVMAAYMDSVPVLVFAGNESSKHFAFTRVLGTQGFDSAQVVKPMVKWSHSPSATSAMADLDKALEIAMEPRRGPIWANFWKDVQGAQL